MPYIGNNLRSNNDYKTVDDISGSFNGSTTSFALQVGGAAPVPFPLYETQLIISVGGVVQEPDSTGSKGFKLSGTNIVFSSAPAAGENFFGVILATADYLNAGGKFPDGTNTVPSITFIDDTDTGLFRVGSGTVAITSNGTKVAQFPTNTGSSGQVLTTDGAGVLSYSTVSGTTINNNADNRIITGSGTANTLEGESNLTFDASTNRLKVNSPAGSQTHSLQVQSDGNANAICVFGRSADDIGELSWLENDGSTRLGEIQYRQDHVNFRHRVGDMRFETTNSGSMTERLRIQSGGGISFNGDTAAANALDDYEEGTWTPVAVTTYISGTPTYYNQVGRYTKIGRHVNIAGYIHFNSITWSNGGQVFTMSGLPFNPVFGGGVTGSCVWQQLDWVGPSKSTYGSNDDTNLSPTVVSTNKIAFNTCGQAKYYIGEMLTGAIGTGTLIKFNFSYPTA